MEQSNALAPSFELDRANQRFILTQLGEMTLVFPSHLVAETLLVERTQILSLPFYDPLVLGCVHSGGQIVPLVDMHLLIGIRMSLVREVLTIVRLGDQAEKLSGVGLAVSQLLGSRTGENLPSDLFETDEADGTPISTGMHLFHLQMIGDRIFQPWRWHSE